MILSTHVFIFNLLYPEYFRLFPRCNPWLQLKTRSTTHNKRQWTDIQQLLWKQFIFGGHENVSDFQLYVSKHTKERSTLLRWWQWGDGDGDIVEKCIMAQSGNWTENSIPLTDIYSRMKSFLKHSVEINRETDILEINLWRFQFRKVCPWEQN